VRALRMTEKDIFSLASEVRATGGPDLYFHSSGG
jgi:hypothetical protein